MKTKKTLETLVLAAALFAGGQAGAAPISLQGSTVTGTYNGSADGMLGADQLHQPGSGSNTTAVSAADQEFISADAGFIFDFTTDGQLIVWRNDPLLPVPGDYRFVFDFGASLAQRIGGLTLLDTGSIVGQPGLAVLGNSSFALDLSNLAWDDGWVNFSLQIDAAAAAAVPEPGALGLLLAGAAGFAVSRRKAAAQAQR